MEISYNKIEPTLYRIKYTSPIIFYSVQNRAHNAIIITALRAKKYMEKITYAELARRVGDMVLMNQITTADPDIYDNLENGELYETDEETGEQKEIYQFFAITKSGADYLKRKTDEIVFYSELLDTYFWGITHFGTPWDGVETEITE